jgi:RNA polymerase sigma factor (sigma-70 family)
MREPARKKASGNMRAPIDKAHLHNLTDGQLLGRFISCHEESAFEEILRRHGPMVLSVCRRTISNWNDAEDAFQATFLLLLQKSGTIAKPDSVGSWLYGVAYRIALKTKTKAARCRVLEEQGREMPTVGPDCEFVWKDLKPILDQEIERLPEKYRSPVVLCYLEGLSYGEVARHLGCSKGTVSLRLARARELLQERLARRDIVLSVGVFLGLMERIRSAVEVPRWLQEATKQAAVLWVESEPIPGPVYRNGSGTSVETPTGSSTTASYGGLGGRTYLGWAKFKLTVWTGLIVTLIIGGSALATLWLSGNSLGPGNNRSQSLKGGKKTLADRLDGLPPKK